MMNFSLYQAKDAPKIYSRLIILNLLCIVLGKAAELQDVKTAPLSRSQHFAQSQNLSIAIENLPFDECYTGPMAPRANARENSRTFFDVIEPRLAVSSVISALHEMHYTKEVNP